MADRCAYPLIDDPDDKKKGFLGKLTKWNNRFRQYHMHRMGINVWFYRGAHWIKAPRSLVATGTGFRFERDNSIGNFRMPVDNYVATNVNNSVARFLRKQYKPGVDAEKNLPDYLAAARLARDIVEHDGEEKGWKDIEHEMAFDFETVGIAIGKTWWDENQLELVPIASTEAVKCTAPGCDTKLKNPVVPFGTPVNHGDLAEPTDGGLRLNACPTCPEPTEMQPYQPSVEEVAEQQPDLLGRPMGDLVPKGEPVWECVPWSEIYPDNAGVGVEPHTMKAWGQKSARSVDWLMARFPEFGEIKAEDAHELIKNHPTMGVNIVWGSNAAAATYDEGIYDNHAALIECHIDPMPYPGLELGHSIYQVGEKVISRPLCVEIPVPEVNGQSSEPRKVKRVSYAAARRTRVPREFWGRTPVDDQIPLQRRLNRLDAQVEDIRERGGPWVAVPTDIELHDRGREGALGVVEYDSANPNWSPKDALVNAQPLTGNVYLQERESIVLSLQRLGAPDVELGKNPSGVNTIGQLQILAEEAQTQRGPSEDDLKRLYEKGWGAYLELKWAFQKEEASIEIEGAAESYERKAYTGTNLLGQTRVRLEAKGSTDKKVLEQEIALKAFQMNLYDLSTVAAREEMLEILQAPKVDAAKSMQVERANQAWLEFKQDGRVPVVDETTVNAMVWWQTLGNSWLSDEGLTMQREADWNQVIRGTAGWQTYYTQAVEKDAAQRMLYEGHPPQNWQAIYIDASQKAAAAGQAAADQAAATGTMAPPPMVIQPPPESGQFLPNSTDQKILMTWKGMLGTSYPTPELIARAAQIAPDSTQLRGIAMRERLLRMYAVLQQCRILSEAQQAAMMPPQPGTLPQQGGA